MAKSLPIKKTPAVPAGGRMGHVERSKTQTMAKAPAPPKGKTTFAEKSTRDAGPK